MIPTSDQLDRNAFFEACNKIKFKKAPIHTKLQKRFIPFLLEEIKDHYQHLPAPVVDTDWEDKFKSVLSKLQHHDEYFLIINLRDLSVEWVSGLENALGYTPEETKQWTIKDQHQIVHDAYFSMFYACASFTSRILAESNEMLVPLKHRYVINLPLRKANGRYVWCKQMSVPLSVDTQGRMIRQLNSYTIVSHFDGVQLPCTPLLFLPDGRRAHELERNIFDCYVNLSQFKPTEIEIQIAETALKIWKSKNASEILPARKNIGVTYAEIAKQIGRDEGPVRNHIDRLKRKIATSFGIRPADIVDAAMLLKRLYCFNNPDRQY